MIQQVVALAASLRAMLQPTYSAANARRRATLVKSGADKTTRKMIRGMYAIRHMGGVFAEFVGRPCRRPPKIHPTPRLRARHRRARSLRPRRVRNPRYRRRHRLPHTAAHGARCRPGSGGDHHRRGHPAAGLYRHVRRDAQPQSESGGARQQYRHRRLFPRRSGGRPARHGSQPYFGIGERSAYRRLSSGLRVNSNFTDISEHSDHDDRSYRRAERQRLGRVRLGCDRRGDQLRSQETRRRHHARLPRRGDPAGRRLLAALHAHQRLLERALRLDIHRSSRRINSRYGRTGAASPTRRSMPPEAPPTTTQIRCSGATT